MEGLNWNAGDAKLANDISTPLITAFGANAAKSFEARQLKRNATASLAKGTREAQEIRRQGKIQASNARAAMSGMGGITTDAGAVRELGDIKKVTDYNALSALFESETEAENLKLKARTSKLEGRQAGMAGVRKSLATVLKNSDKIFGK